jgi:hypothetical protein
MAKSSGLGDNFYIGGYDLSGDVASLDKISAPIGTIEATPVKNLAEVRLFGQRDGTMQFTTYFENTGTTSTPGFPASNTPVANANSWNVFVTITGGTLSNVLVNGVSVGTTAGTYVVPSGQTIAVVYTVSPTWNWTGVLTEHNALSSLPRSDTIATYFRGTSVGNAAASVSGVQLNYDFTRDQKGSLTAQVEVDGDKYGMEWGKMLTAGLRADTAPTTGAFYDNGAAFNYGAQAYLQLVALVGTNVDVVIQHATTSGGAYSTLIDFGSQTAIGSFRGSVSNTTTVNEFFKVVTTGTFTYAQFAVMINVNPVAGVVFLCRWYRSHSEIPRSLVSRLRSVQSISSRSVCGVRWIRTGGRRLARR